ncbi:MAG: TonB-dependent receptor [Bacteroidia bacterium]
MIRKIAIPFVFLIVSVIGSAQSKTYRIEASNQPLNTVLLQLRNQYDFQFSYSENQVSQFEITVSKTFYSKEEAVRFLLRDLPLHLKIMDNVFIIIPDTRKKKTDEGKYLAQIAGQIVEAGSSEPLPYSNILINNHPMVADVTGNFNYTTLADSSYRVRISHLGYYVYDTLVYAGIDQRFKLIPSSIKLAEIRVQNNIIENATMVGERTGKITINHNIARLIPGQGDNSVFNMIRLMPGIQAAGEQSNDLLIWGSYEGQSLITFDEFTLFGLKNYSDNISVVNPFLVKNIEIFKGAYDAKYGNRIGGIINMTGKNGNMQKPVFSLNINNTTVNGMVEIPLFKKSSLLMAYRQTYYNLYNSSDFNVFAPTKPKPKQQTKSTQVKDITFDMNVYPDDYRFNDLNLKYTWNFDNGDQFYVSLYGGGDQFSLATEANLTREMHGMHNTIKTTDINIGLLNKEVNKQRGMSVFYNKTWNSLIVSKFVFSHSDFSKQLSEEVKSSNSTNQNIYNQDFSKTGNKAIENSFRMENQINFRNGHYLEFGGGFYRDEAEIASKINLQDTLSIDALNQFNSNRAFAYLQDNLPVGERLLLHTGLRMNRSFNNSKFYFEPRLSATYKLTEQLKLMTSIGRYHQFMYKVANIDKDQNYSYLWLTNNENTPVQNAVHWAGGINYFKNNLTINAEAYYKMSHNLTERVFERRYVGRNSIDGYFPYFGNAKTYGLDIYAKKDFGNHSVWASYTISKALESFAPANKKLPLYTSAPQDQLHELKVAAIFNIGHFYLSSDFVYGSGLEILRKVFKDVTNDVSYNRVDAAVTYKFNPKHLSGEVGLSILNLFDAQNLKYANLKTIQLSPELGNIRVYSNAVAFTPILFLKLVF